MKNLLYLLLLVFVACSSGTRADDDDDRGERRRKSRTENADYRDERDYRDGRDYRDDRDNRDERYYRDNRSGASEANRSGQDFPEDRGYKATNTDPLVGDWEMTNAPSGFEANLRFDADGGLVIYGGKINEKPETMRGSWARNGDVVYVSSPGEEEVGVMEILSLNANSLVIHFREDPEDKINYFRRK